MTLKYVKKIKGTGNKNRLKNATCKQGLRLHIIAQANITGQGLLLIDINMY